MRPSGAARLILLMALVATSMIVRGSEQAVAERQWVAVYDYRPASDSRSCSIYSSEARIGVSLTDDTDGQRHMVQVGGDRVPGRPAWLRVDSREPLRLDLGFVAPDQAFSVIGDMLLGGYAYLEWEQLPDGELQEEKAGLGYFAWAYALCRAKLGWAIPTSLKKVLERRYEESPDLEDPVVMTRDEFDQQAEGLRREYERLLEEARELGISPPGR